MTFMEAKARAFCNSTNEIFEKAFSCKIPQEMKDEFLKETLEQMKPLEEWVTKNANTTKR